MNFDDFFSMATDSTNFKGSGMKRPASFMATCTEEDSEDDGKMKSESVFQEEKKNPIEDLQNKSKKAMQKILLLDKKFNIIKQKVKKDALAKPTLDKITTLKKDGLNLKKIMEKIAQSNTKVKDGFVTEGHNNIKCFIDWASESARMLKTAKAFMKE